LVITVSPSKVVCIKSPRDMINDQRKSATGLQTNHPSTGKLQKFNSLDGITSQFS
jgi:hypothetical protein